jgi:subtilisin family serine protease
MQSQMDFWARAGNQGSGIVVAMLDTGIDISHLDFSSAHIVSKDACDPDASGYDIDGHGTQCCGIVHGVAPACTLLSIRILPVSGSFSFDTLLTGLSIAASHNADVVCICSGDRNVDPDVEEAVTMLTQSGCTVVAAVGNRGRTGPRAGLFPARCKDAMAIGTADIGGELSSFTELPADKQVICLPGTEFIVPMAGGNRTTITGTSASASYAAGLFALAINQSGKTLKGRKLAAFVAARTEARKSNRGDYLLLDPLRLVTPVS